MINDARIVPVERIDLISLYGLVLKQDTATLAKVDADTVGAFDITSASTALLASEPVKTVNFASGVSTATLYFVAAYDYEGFSVNGTAVVPTGDVEADGCTLYKAELASGAVTITKIGF